MAKRNGTISEDDLKRLVTARALERFAAGIVDQMDDPKARIPAGVYTLKIETIDPICGDITVGDPVEIAAGEGPAVKHEEILAALFAGKSQGEIASELRPAFERLAKARSKSKADAAGARTAEAKIASAAAFLEGAIESGCRKCELWKKTSASSRAGKTEGQPVGRLSSVVNRGESEIEVHE